MSVETSGVFVDPEPFFEVTQGWRSKREPNRGHWIRKPRTQTEYEHDRMVATAPPGGEIIRLEDMALADIKAMFAADGTFNIAPDGRVTS